MIGLFLLHTWRDSSNSILLRQQILLLWEWLLALKILNLWLNANCCLKWVCILLIFIHHIFKLMWHWWNIGIHRFIIVWYSSFLRNFLCQFSFLWFKLVWIIHHTSMVLQWEFLLLVLLWMVYHNHIFFLILLRMEVYLLMKWLLNTLLLCHCIWSCSLHKASFSEKLRLWSYIGIRLSCCSCFLS